MKTHTIGIADLQACTAWGRRRIATLLTKEPALLPHKVHGPKGGNPRVYYDLKDILPRFSDHKLFTAKHAIDLIALDQKKRLNQ